MIRKLIVNDGRGERERLLVGQMLVGRDPTCDISDADPLLSGRHAELTVAGAVVTIRDLGSRNGILINGEKVAHATLRSGDVVQAGRLRLTYVEDGAPAPAGASDSDATSLVNPLQAAQAIGPDPDATRLVNPRAAAQPALQPPAPPPVIAAPVERPVFATVPTAPRAPAAPERVAPIGPVLAPAAVLGLSAFLATTLSLGWLGIGLAGAATGLAVTLAATWIVSTRIHRRLCENYVPKAPKL